MSFPLASSTSPGFSFRESVKLSPSSLGTRSNLPEVPLIVKLAILPFIDPITVFLPLYSATSIRLTTLFSLRDVQLPMSVLSVTSDLFVVICGVGVIFWVVFLAVGKGLPRK